MQSNINAIVPIACHYDEETLLTQSGQLVKIIRVDADNCIDIDLRQIIRDGISEVASDLAFYLHVVRNEIPEVFISDPVELQWRVYHKVQKSFQNTLYISLVHAGISTRSAFRSILESALFGAFKKRSFDRLDSCKGELNTAVTKLLSILEPLRPEVLKVKDDGADLISEPLSFYKKLITLKEAIVPFATQDAGEQLSDSLSISKLGYSSLEIHQKQVKDRVYAAVFTIKNTSELSRRALDRLLQSHHNFIVTECAIPIKSSAGRKYWNKYHSMIHSEAMERLIPVQTQDRYYARQCTIVCYAEELNQFTESIDTFLELIGKIGLTLIREDLYSFGAFFSIMPGNFRYIKRTKPLNVNKLGIFTQITHQKIGIKHYSKFDCPPIIFNDIDTKLPYYFNFIDKGGTAAITICSLSQCRTAPLLCKFILHHLLKSGFRFVGLEWLGSYEGFLKQRKIQTITPEEIGLPTEIASRSSSYSKIFSQMPSSINLNFNRLFNQATQENFTAYVISTLLEVLKSLPPDEPTVVLMDSLMLLDFNQLLQISSSLREKKIVFIFNLDLRVIDKPLRLGGAKFFTGLTTPLSQEALGYIDLDENDHSRLKISSQREDSILLKKDSDALLVDFNLRKMPRIMEMLN